MFFSLLFYIASFILVISVVVFIHEFGHYFFAKLFKVKVEAFSIGFGPEIFGTNDKSGTRWKFSSIPAGGYVKLFGDFNEASTPDQELLSSLSEEEKKATMHFKPLYQKALIVAGGPLSNLVFAFLILWFFFAVFGKPFIEPVATLVKENSAAEKVGIKAGDRIISINNNTIEWFGDIKRIMVLNTGNPLNISYIREGIEHKVTLTPDVIKSVDFLGNEVTVPTLGILSDKMLYKSSGFFIASSYALTEMYDIMDSTIKIIGQIVTGKRDTSSLGGPIKIAKYSGQSIRKGAFAVFWFLAMVSINLGVVNLLPIPLLDGGHLFFYLIEFIKGPKIAFKYQNFSSKISMIFLGALFLFITINDIRHLIK